jgi:hypothetical protein
MWRWVGVAIKAVALGTLLFLALAKLVQLSTGAKVFQYQGF